MMHSTRQVLRPTQNRLPLKDVSKVDQPTKVAFTTANTQQENRVPSSIQTKIPLTTRPILTAIRSIKTSVKENYDDDETSMLISPMVKTARITEIKVQKTREELEEELFELPDYRSSIFEHLKSIEQLYAPKSNFLDHQSEINSPMRTILVDWLVEVADEYKLNDDTLFLCVQYADRFLSTVNVTRSKLQLLGTTCMYLASKYEEMYPPALEEFSFITDNTYESQHILRMEQIVMKMLNFSLSGPTSYTFLQHYLTSLKSSNDDDYQCLRMLSNYLSTLTLLHDRPFSSYRPSIIAASCLLLANRLLAPSTIWSNRYIEITSYQQSDLNECTLALEDLQKKTFEQDKMTCSLLRRYLKFSKEDRSYHERVREIIHKSKGDDDEDEDDDDDDGLDLTLDESDENQMSLDHHHPR